MRQVGLGAGLENSVCGSRIRARCSVAAKDISYLVLDRVPFGFEMHVWI